jgi:hypothetical protein
MPNLALNCDETYYSVNQILLRIVPDLQGGGDGASGQDEEQHEGGPDAGVPQTTLHRQVGAQHTPQCTVGGFNVSNLIGIKRRMIDISKRITFYFLQNG